MLLAAAALAAAAAPGGGTSTRGDVGPTAPSTTISFALSLRLDQALLARDLAAGRPPLANAAALGRRYGLPLADIRRVAYALQAGGAHVTRIYPQRTWKRRSSVCTLARASIAVRCG